MKTAIKWVGVAVVLVAVSGCAYAFNKIRQWDLATLQTCSQHSTFPGSTWVCRQALERYEPTPADIADLNRTVGATVPLMVSDDAEAKRLLQRYMAAGLDINARDTVRPDMGWTSLHMLVIAPDVRGINILLDAGARTDIQDGQGRTPLELLRQQSKKFPSVPGYAEAERLLLAAEARPAETK